MMSKSDTCLSSSNEEQVKALPRLRKKHVNLNRINGDSNRNNFNDMIILVSILPHNICESLFKIKFDFWFTAGRKRQQQWSTCNFDYYGIQQVPAVQQQHQKQIVHPPTTTVYQQQQQQICYSPQQQQQSLLQQHYAMPQQQQQHQQIAQHLHTYDQTFYNQPNSSQQQQSQPNDFVYLTTADDRIDAVTKSIEQMLPLLRSSTKVTREKNVFKVIETFEQAKEFDENLKDAVYKDALVSKIFHAYQ